MFRAAVSGVESLVVPTILCIDDHEPTLQTLCWLFEANGYTCLSSSSAKTALQVFRDNLIDIVILDHTLETDDGSALAGILKNVRNVPILMLSGWADLKKPDGIDVLLIKPQEPKVLLGAVLNLLVRGQTTSA
jgi:DNA-binding response OmpR family regulator